MNRKDEQTASKVVQSDLELLLAQEIRSRSIEILPGAT